jgi:small-conductance mechanosensitive channel
MDLIDPTILTAVKDLWRGFELMLKSLLLPPQQLQIAIMVAAMALAYGLSLLASPAMERSLRGLENRPKWQLRTLVQLRRSLRGIFFVLLVWLAVVVIAHLSPFPSRRYLMQLVASIAAAWVTISLVARLIRNRLLRKIVVYGATVWVTIHFLGFMDPATAFLDSIAIQFGEFRLSILSVIKALVVTGVLFALARMVASGTARRIRANPDISPSMRELSVKAIQIILFGTAFFVGLKAVGFDLTGLAVLSGAIGIGLGFGLQKVVSNLVSGVIILLDKSIKPGDVISLGDTFGWIESLGARYVSVVTRDGKEYLIPNEDLITGQVVNWSHSNDFVRLDLYFGTSYGDDPHVVRKLAMAAAESADRVLKERPAVCHIVGFGDSSVDYILRFWISDPSSGLTNIRGNVYLALWDTFKINGISIPFPQREVRVLGEERSETAPRVPRSVAD